MNIVKLPSGNYRARKMIERKNYSVIFDHKPTQNEANKAVMDLYKAEKERKENDLPDNKILFSSAAGQYTDLKRNVLSPASIREYDRMCNRLPEWFTKMEISEIDNKVMQKLVNEMATSLSPKTVKDRYSFCVSVISLFIPRMVFDTTLPKKIDSEPYIPSHEDVNKVLNASVGTRYHIPLQLACYGLRREEICAVEVSDLDEDNFLTINKALVQDTNKNWIIKETKTEESTRTIAIDDELANQIRELPGGRIFDGFPQTIAKFIGKTQDELGLERFSLHKFRHYFCTTLAENNIPEADILAMGGWKTDAVMKRVYRHSNIERERERLKQATNVLKKARG